MQLKIGSYSFDANTNLIATSLETLFNQGEQPYAQVRRLEVEGYLTGSGQNDLSAKENALKSAMAPIFGDISFVHDDGSESSIILHGGDSISGVKVVRGPDFPRTYGPEFATERHFRFTAEAEYPLPNTSNFLLEFEEELSLSGGGPVYIHLPALNTIPQKQLLWPAVPYKATQTGFAAGYRDWPVAPPPLFPAALKQSGNFSRKSPRRRGLDYEHFRISWAYEFESAFPILGVPNRWIG